MTEYRIPTGYGEAEFTEKRSRFIGRVWPVETEEEAVARIKEMRETHWDATHNVYAYALREGNLLRYSDDGEPQGTSGMPTLAVFRGAEVTNVCCVVTRYFGGILLGTGGLARAYSRAAKLALEAAGISVVRLWKQLALSCSYSQYEKMKNAVVQAGGRVEDTQYGADVRFALLLPEANWEAFVRQVRDATAGTVDVALTGETFCAVPLEE